MIDPVLEAFVLTKRFFYSLLAGWPMVVTFALACRAAFMRIGPSDSEYLGWIAFALAPVLTAMLLARGRSTETIAQVLHETEQRRDGRRRG